MHRLRLIVIALLIAAPAIAIADDGSAELEKGLPNIVPAKGLQKASVKGPQWCGAVKVPKVSDWGYSVKAMLDGWRPKPGHETNVLHSAARLCAAPDGNPVAARVAAVVEQMWINTTGMTEADALASLSARANEDAWDAERDKFCATIPESSDGEEQWFATARRTVFGCDGGDPQWMRSRDLRELASHVEGAVANDQILHLAWVQFRLKIDLDKTQPIERTIPGYVLDQFDLSIDTLQFSKALETAPYKGNRFAHIVAAESLAHERLLAAELEAAVAAKVASDPVWKELLIFAPKHGYADWLAAAAQHKVALASTDCAVLRPDLVATFKKLKHDTIENLSEALSNDPLAGLLLSRFAKCEKGAAQLVGTVRIVSGARMGAYFATLDALGAIKGRAPFSGREISDLVYERHLQGSNDRAMSYQGVVSAIGKAKNGVKVTFIQHKQQVMGQECVDGKKVDRIDPDSGKVYYRKVCHNTGLIWVTDDPDPIVIPSSVAAGIKVGAFMRFLRSGEGTPLEVYTDKSAKKLVAYYGFALE